jgi:hypothetical protein
MATSRLLPASSFHLRVSPTGFIGSPRSLKRQIPPDAQDDDFLVKQALEAQKCRAAFSSFWGMLQPETSNSDAAKKATELPHCSSIYFSETR